MNACTNESDFVDGNLLKISHGINELEPSIYLYPLRKIVYTFDEFLLLKPHIDWIFHSRVGKREKNNCQWRRISAIPTTYVRSAAVLKF